MTVALQTVVEKISAEWSTVCSNWGETGAQETRDDLAQISDISVRMKKEVIDVTDSQQEE